MGTWVEHIMGMPVSLRVRGPVAPSTVDEVFAGLRLVDRLFSTYRPDSQISRVNAGTLRLGDCDPLVRHAMGLCEEARERTGGYFDALLPGPDGRPRWDPSGLVKGWAVERAGALLADRGATGFCLNAGGDMVLRSAPGQPPWRVGVEDPAAPDGLLTVLAVRDGAVATSGTARRGAHILDPFTGRPATGPVSVTVVGPSLTWADVYATAAVARGTGADRWLAGLPGYRALVVDRTGTRATDVGGLLPTQNSR